MPVYFAFNYCVDFHKDHDELRRTHWLYKVGFTDKDTAEERLGDIPTTWSPIPWEIVWAVEGGRDLEREIHEELRDLGLSYSFYTGGTEFFGIPRDFDIGAFLLNFVPPRGVIERPDACPVVHEFQARL